MSEYCFLCEGPQDNMPIELCDKHSEEVMDRLEDIVGRDLDIALLIFPRLLTLVILGKSEEAKHILDDLRNKLR